MELAVSDIKMQTALISLSNVKFSGTPYFSFWATPCSSVGKGKRKDKPIFILMGKKIYLFLPRPCRDGVVRFRTDTDCVWVNCGLKVSTCRVWGGWNNGNWLESTILILKETGKKKDFRTSHIIEFISICYVWPVSSERSWFLDHHATCPGLSFSTCKPRGGESRLLFCFVLLGVPRLVPEMDWLCNLTSHTLFVIPRRPLLFCSFRNAPETTQGLSVLKTQGLASGAANYQGFPRSEAGSLRVVLFCLPTLSSEPLYLLREECSVIPPSF